MQDIRLVVLGLLAPLALCFSSSAEEQRAVPPVVSASSPSPAAALSCPDAPRVPTLPTKATNLNQDEVRRGNERFKFWARLDRERLDCMDRDIKSSSATDASYESKVAAFNTEADSYNKLAASWRTVLKAYNLHSAQPMDPSVLGPGER